MAKILIVDDDATIVGLMTALMAMEGHTSHAVHDSTKAVEAANAFRPDLITLDLMMPGLTGFDLCELMRKDPGLAKIPILIVSARDDPESKIKARQLGATDYLTKPFGVDNLLSKIKELTGSS